MIHSIHKLDGCPKVFRDAAEVLSKYLNQDKMPNDHHNLGYELFISSVHPEFVYVCAWNPHAFAERRVTMLPWKDLDAVNKLLRGCKVEMKPGYECGVVIVGTEEPETETPVNHSKPKA